MPSSRQDDGTIRAPALACILAVCVCRCARGHVCRWWFCGIILSDFRTPPRTVPCAVSGDLVMTPPRSTAVCLSSQHTRSPSTCTRHPGRLWCWRSDVSASWPPQRCVHSYREILRFICGHHLLRCQIALVLNEKLVDTVGGMLVDLTHPNHHVAERLPVRDIVDCDDAVCAYGSIS